MGSEPNDFTQEEIHSTLSLVLNAFTEAAGGTGCRVIEDSPSSARIVFEDSGITVRLKADRE